MFNLGRVVFRDARDEKCGRDYRESGGEMLELTDSFEDVFDKV